MMNGVLAPDAPVVLGDDVAAELDRILSQHDLRPVYQPIIAVSDERIFAYESLIRGPQDSPLQFPSELFATAAAEDRLAELEMACREISIKGAAALKLDGFLFLNTLPQFLSDPDFPHGEIIHYIEAAGLNPSKLVLEITEQHPVVDYDALRHALGRYRAAGFRIALDDLGAGYAGLRQWSELRPDFVKIDRHFVSQIHHDAARRQFVHSICEISHILDCEVIAEGIEEEEEYEVVRSLGVHYVQGYYFARPMEDPVRQLARRRSGRSAGAVLCRHCTQTVGALVKEHLVVQADQRVRDVAALFQQIPNLLYIPVLRRKRPVGVVKRSELLTLYASLYGRDLHGRKQISEFMSRDPFVVDSDTPVEQLSQRLTQGSVSLNEEGFIVVDQAGEYLGTGTLTDLLRVITELQVRNARYANPLTQMPGNVPISEHIDALINSEHPFVVVYTDLDYFKPYNDHYGYARGDDAIRALARILRDHIDPRLDFVGHVGGDDFILVFRSKDWRQRCAGILEKFEQYAPRLYDQCDRDRGGIEALDRKGNRGFFSILSVSLGAVLASRGRFFSHHEISSIASEVKAQAKAIDGNALFIDRRS